jgi:hypothetical protein
LPIGSLFKYIAKQVGIGMALSAIESALTGSTTTSTTSTSTNPSRRSFEPYYARDFSEEERREDVMPLAATKLSKPSKSLIDHIAGGIAGAIGFDLFGSLINHLHNNTTK